MKISRLITAVAISILAVSCDEERKGQQALDIIGEWELVDYQTKAITIGDQTIETFITFREDNTFGLRQMLGAGRFREFEGTWTLTESVLDGKYSDGTSWGSPYQISIDEGLLHMTPQYDEGYVDSIVETYIYRKTN